jgi:hypothetical protein
MNSFRQMTLLGALSLCLGQNAQAQATASVDYEAVALRYFLTTLLPQDRPTYRKLSYSGRVLPGPHAFIFFPCFAPFDSLRREEGAINRWLGAPSTGKTVPIPPSSALKVVRRGGRSIPWVSVSDALDLRAGRVVPICLSLLYHYTDYYFITLDSAGQVVSACRRQTIQ